jgi:hypothetical protein
MSLSEKKGVWTTLELQAECQQAGFGRSSVAREIANLTQIGKLIKVRHGEYELAGKSQSLILSS